MGIVVVIVLSAEQREAMPIETHTHTQILAHRLFSDRLFNY